MKNAKSTVTREFKLTFTEKITLKDLRDFVADTSDYSASSVVDVLEPKSVPMEHGVNPGHIKITERT